MKSFSCWNLWDFQIPEMLPDLWWPPCCEKVIIMTTKPLLSSLNNIPLVVNMTNMLHHCFPLQFVFYSCVSVLLMNAIFPVASLVTGNHQRRSGRFSSFALNFSQFVFKQSVWTLFQHQLFSNLNLKRMLLNEVFFSTYIIHNLLQIFLPLEVFQIFH